MSRYTGGWPEVAVMSGGIQALVLMVALTLPLTLSELAAVAQAPQRIYLPVVVRHGTPAAVTRPDAVVTPSPTPTLAAASRADTTPTLTPAPPAGPMPSPAASPSPTVTAAYVLTAWVSDPQPRQRTEVTVSARLTRGGLPVGGAAMHATWAFRTTTSACTSATGSDGVAACARNIGAATVGHPVTVTVAVMPPGGATVTTQTSFTPAP